MSDQLSDSFISLLYRLKDFLIKCISIKRELMLNKFINQFHIDNKSGL